MSSLSLKRPLAWLPLVLSLTALGMVLVHYARFGNLDASGHVPQDEGAEARIFQLLMVAQALIALWFAITWLPREPKKTLLILSLQAFAAILALATVIVLER